ncbi:MAG: extracellular solute-binding protein [Synechococcaceae cyanobacterium]|nr:extracellular solute-binding protein [Synechococcaceae cyanobacterium]
MAALIPILRPCRLALALLLASLLGACGTASSNKAEPEALRGTTFVMIGTRGHTEISRAVQEEQGRLLDLLDADFQTLHPETQLQVDLFREASLPAVVADRSRDGLGPDLILVGSGIARSLMDAGLSRPVPLTAELRRLIPAHLLAQVVRGADQLVGIPVLLEPQLACFDRRRLAQSPSSLSALEALDERGIEVGLPIDAFDLYWTVGAYGAHSAMARLTRGAPLSAADQQTLLRWLRWLRTVNLRERVNFFNSQEDLLQGLLAGRLDWISCRSTHFERLQRVLGPRFGVALLPSGPGGPATPLIRQRVWVFGRDSSPGQRRLAEDFVRFSLTPTMQRFLTLHTRSMLPVSREVEPPSGGSPVLRAMVASEQQSWVREAIGPELRGDDPRLERQRRLFLSLIYSELSPEQVLQKLMLLRGRGR